MRKKIHKYSSTLAFARQNSEHLTLVVLIFCAIILINLSRSDFMNNIRNFSQNISVGIMEVVSSPAQFYNNMTDKIGGFWGVYQENQDLKIMNQELMEYRQKYVALIAEQKSLQEILKYTPANEKNFQIARIVGDSSNLNRSQWLVNLGAKNNITLHSNVFANQALVGLVVNVSDNGARVLRLNDKNSYVPITVAGKNFRGMLHGLGTPNAEILYRDGADDLTEGDEIITSGQGGLYHPFVPVGVVKSPKDEAPRVTLYAEQSPPLLVKIVPIK